jgi:allantoinase
MHDVLVTGATIVSGDGRRRADLAISGEKVAALLDPGSEAQARTVVDASGLVILPGLIDTHVHLRDPARPDRETFVTGTSAAAAGGVTTIFEMPTSDPPVNSGERLRRRAETVAPSAIVDFALYGGAGAANVDDIGGLADAGAIAFKTWLHAPSKGREHEFIGLSCPDEEDLRVVMTEVARTGLRHAMHAEDQSALEHAHDLVRGMEAEPGLVYAASRPTTVEDTAVQRVLGIAGRIGARVQIVHMSSPESIRMVAAARAEGVDATAEVAPHYLVLDEKVLKTYGSFAKCNPPLRPESTLEQIWLLLQQGAVDVIGSDHCPYLESELEAGQADIFTSPPGLPGLETMLPILLSGAHRGRLSLEDVARLTAEGAAELFHLPAKGRVAAGFDADFVIIDPDETWSYAGRQTFSKAGANARYFEGSTFTGRVRETWLRGTRVFEGGRITVEPGYGRFVTPSRP